MKIFTGFFKKILANFYTDFIFKRIIHLCDKNKSNSFKISFSKEDLYNAQEFKKSGILILKNLNFSENKIAELISFFLDKEDFTKKPICNIPVIINSNSIIAEILSNQKIINYIKYYLGDDAILDTVTLSSTNSSVDNKIVSEQWHYDNVGNRIKLFFYLNDNNSISTDYILETNNLYHKRYSTLGSRISNQHIEKYQSKMYKFFPKKNTLFFFDTNGFHRGNYKYNDNSKDNSIRRMIKFEFSSEFKSKKFFLKSHSIGPRFTFLSNDFNIDSCEFIKKKYLTKVNDIFIYDSFFKFNH